MQWTKGRLIVSVTDGNASGLILGDPLGDQEDRGHLHSFEGTLPLSERHIAAIDCCNDQGAANGDDPFSGFSSNTTSGIPFLQLYLCSLHADDSTLTLPIGAVGYVDPNVTTSCPTMWTPYEIAAGRFIVTGDYSAGQQPVTSIDEPLASLEDRKHTHTYSTQVTVNDVSYVGIDGCCNDHPAASGPYTLSGAVDEASTGLPYAQLLTCSSATPSFNASMPDNALFFSPQIGCQSGWEVASFLSGRFIVSVPEGGLSGATFGGDSLAPGTTSLTGTSHQLSTTITLPSTGVGLGSGCCADGYAEAGDIAFVADTTSASAGLPYIMVPMCIHSSMAARWKAA